MLSLSSKNCKTFAAQMQSPMQEIKAGLDQAIQSNYAAIWAQM